MKTNLMKLLTILPVYILLLASNILLDTSLDYNFFFPTDLYMALTTTCEGFNPSDAKQWLLKYRRN